jgi:uncharacterized protein Yka (UPF0111/DUF47 family)
MVAKATIVNELGQQRLLLPTLIERALIANEQAKYWFALLQNARLHADHPTQQIADLRRERIAARIRDDVFDRSVAGATLISPNRYQIPSGQAALTGILQAIEAMLEPLEEDEATGFRSRLAALAEGVTANDIFDAGLINRMASGDRDRQDSLHLLVMDLHKALNRVQASIATETLDGARVRDLSENSRALVGAFMAGVNRTSPLRFDHPGLATTAAEWNDRLVIQNDLGTTDAHVLVVTVEDPGVTVTYTDIHPERLAFFRGLFAAFPIEWSASQRHTAAMVESGGYVLSVGILRTAELAARKQFLELLGSRLVFLIDWNRARKRLQSLINKKQAIALLRWAADQEVGHRGFLVIGGERAIFDAMEFAVAGRLHYGDRLADLLGEEGTSDFLRWVLQTATEGLIAGRLPALIKDEIKVELRARLQTSHQQLFAIAARHAGYIKEISGAIYRYLAPSTISLDAAATTQLAARAARWEREADNLLNTARREIHDAHAPSTMLACLESADDAADCLEDGAFFLTLLVRHGGTETLLSRVAPLAELVDEDARAFVSCLDCVQCLGRAGPRADLDDFLAAIQRIIEIEHRADTALREATATITEGATGFRDLYLGGKFAEAMEGATDHLARSVQILKQYALEEVMQG